MMRLTKRRDSFRECSLGLRRGRLYGVGHHQYGCLARNADWDRVGEKILVGEFRRDARCTVCVVEIPGFARVRDAREMKLRMTAGSFSFSARRSPSATWPITIRASGGRQGVVGVDPMLVLGEECGIVDLAYVVVECSGSDRGHVGAYAACGRRCEVAHGHGVLECAGHSSEFAQCRVVDVRRLHEGHF